MALNSRFSEIGFCGVLDASCFPCENWESVNRGLGDAEFAILRMGKRTQLVILQRTRILL